MQVLKVLGSVPDCENYKSSLAFAHTIYNQQLHKLLCVSSFTLLTDGEACAAAGQLSYHHSL